MKSRGAHGVIVNVIALEAPPPGGIVNTVTGTVVPPGAAEKISEAVMMALSWVGLT